MLSCSICKREFGRGDNLQRHMRNKHNSLETMDQMTSSTITTFKQKDYFLLAKAILGRSSDHQGRFPEWETPYFRQRLRMFKSQLRF